jgi:hypothetical protein
MTLIQSGVYLPTFETVTEGGSDFGLTGLGRGGQQVQRYRFHLTTSLISRAIEVYTKAVETLVELASLQVCSLSQVTDIDARRQHLSSWMRLSKLQTVVSMLLSTS